MATARISAGVYTTLTFSRGTTIPPFGEEALPNPNIGRNILDPNSSFLTIREITFDTEVETWDRSNAFTYFKMLSPAQMTGNCTFSGYIPVTNDMNLQIGLYYNARIQYDEPDFNSFQYNFSFLINKIDFGIAVDGAYKVDISGSIFPIKEVQIVKDKYLVPKTEKLDNNSKNRSYRPIYMPAVEQPITNIYKA
jgi:hypothetical protein